MSPEKHWFKEFKKLIEQSGLIDELELQRKYTTSWSNVSFPIPPDILAEQVLDFTNTVGQMIESNIIDGAQGYRFIKDLLLKIFNYQFDIFFIYL